MNEAPKVPGNNSLPQGTSTGGITPPTGGTPGVPTQGGANPKLQATAQATAVLDKVTGADQSMPSVGEKVVDLDNPQIDENGDVVEPQLKPGDKIAPGKEVDENGEVKETALNKTLKSVGTGAAAYFSGGNAEVIGEVQNIENSKTGQQLIGVISDTVENSGLAGKAVEKAAEVVDDAGVNEAIDGAAKTLVAAKNGDIEGVKEGAKEIKKGADKAKDFTRPFRIIAVLCMLSPLIFGFMTIMILFMSEENENETTSEQVYKNTYQYGWGYSDDQGGNGNSDSGGNGGNHTEYQGKRLSEEEIQKIISQIPGWNSLSIARQTLIKAALSAVGLPYEYGGKANGPGLSGIPSSGIDCSGFVNWAYWTALGSNPSFGGTDSLYNNSSGKFNQVNYNAMRPGDIGVRRSGGSGHTAIYLGNNKWVHASSKKTGIKVSVYNTQSQFSRYFSYEGI